MWWRWSARVCLVAATLAVIELTLAAALVPLVRSDLLGAMVVLHLTAVVYAVALAPVAVVAALIDRRWGDRLGARLDAVEPVPILSRVVGLALAVVAVLALANLGAGYPEFPERMTMVVGVLGFVAAAVAMMAAALVLRPALHAVAARWRALADPRIASSSLAGVVAVTSIIAAHVAFGGLLLFGLSALAGLAAAAALLFAFVAARWPKSSPRSQGRAWLVAPAVAVALAPASSCRHHLGSYLFHNHMLAAGALGAELAAVADVDGDGTVASWLGGTDCAPFDATRGPGRIEVVGDGVDQDCRGGDARGEPPLATAASFRQHFGCDQAELQGALLIVLDAVRADALSPETTPVLAGLRGRSVDFARAYSPAASTIQSMGGLFSGRSLTARLDPATSTLLLQVVSSAGLLPTRLADGQRRVLAIDNLALPSALVAGFEPSFPWWLDSAPRNGKERFEAAAVTNETIRQLSAMRGAPFFLWAHYTDAHAPYLPLDGRLEGLSDYEREVAYVDMHLGRLLAFLERSGLAERVAVVVTADHGEELGERIVEGHGRYLYESSVHVPLLVDVPGCPAARVERPVSLTQVAPTIASLLGAPPETPSLASATHVVVETMDRDVSHRAIVGERFKLVVDVRHGGRVLFDLDADPTETNDVLTEHPEAASSSAAAYQRFLDQRGAAVLASPGDESGHRARK